MLKKRLWILICALMCCFVCGLAVACGNDEADDGGDTTKQTITLERNTVEMELYEQLTLTATPEPAGTVTWTTSNDDAVLVDGGTLTAVGVGKATITAAVGTASAKCEVTVVSTTNVPTLNLGRAAIEVIEGDSLTVTPSVTYLGSAVSDAAFSYSIDKTDIVTVTAEGVVTGVSYGTARLTVTAQWRGATLTQSVEVSVKADANISILYEDETIETLILRLSNPASNPAYITSAQLTAITEEGGSEVDRTVTWSILSGDSVSLSDGIVTATKVGETTVQAAFTTDDDIEIAATAVITVVLPEVELTESLGTFDIRNMQALDLASEGLVGNIISITQDGVPVAEIAGGKVDLLAEWYLTAELAEQDIVIATDEVIYHAALTLFESYKDLDMSTTNDYFMFYAHTSVTAEFTFSEEGVAGKENVWHFNASAGNTYYSTAYLSMMGADAVAGDEGIRAAEIKEDFDYAVISLYINTGHVDLVYGPYGSSSQINLEMYNGYPIDEGYKYNPNETVDTDIVALCLNANGERMTNFATGQWMTIVLDLNEVEIGADGTMFRLSTGSWNNHGDFYVEYIRYYTTEELDVLNCVYESSISLDAPEDTANIVMDVYEGVTKVQAPVISYSGYDEGIISISGNTVTAKAFGATTITATYGTITRTINVAVGTPVSETITVDVNDPSTWTLSSDEITGTISDVQYEGSSVSGGATLTDAFVKSVGQVALVPVTRSLVIATSEGAYYVANVQFTGEYDRFDLGLIKSQVSASASSWTDVTKEEGYAAIVGDRDEVYRYTGTRADFWSTLLYNNDFFTDYADAAYGTLTFDLYYESGTSLIMYIGGKAYRMFGDQTDNNLTTELPFTVGYSENGSPLEGLEGNTGKWITLTFQIDELLATAGSSGRIGFCTLDSGTVFYVSDMRLNPPAQA